MVLSANGPSDSGSPENPKRAPPLPAFLADGWLRDHGVDDVEGFRRAMRPESHVMAPATLRAIKATRLSFSRTLMRRMAAGGWRVARRHSDVDAQGRGLLVYDIQAEGEPLTFVVHCAASSGADRLGRFYETAYDFYGSLREGRVGLDDARREGDDLATHLWRARAKEGTLGWTIANRSNRFFDHVVERLAAGSQPDLSLLATGGGYIVRNAGWYGNGRQGTRSWLSLPPGHPLAHPYHVDLFALYLWRVVGSDVANIVAQMRSPETAVRLSVESERYLGVGNSSGIGMVAALVRWPAWLGTFNLLREAAIAFAVTRPVVDADKLQRLGRLLDNAERYFRQQAVSDVGEVATPGEIADGLAVTRQALADILARDERSYPFARVSAAAGATGCREVVEQVNAILIETEAQFADALDELMRDGMNLSRAVDPAMRVGDLRRLLADRYAWALDLDLAHPDARAHFWYKSEENGENRRGERALDPGVENETFVDVAGVVQALDAALEASADTDRVAEFLFLNPEFTNAVSRAQLAAHMPYTEIRGNIIHRDFLPMDAIRFLLSTFGLENSVPYSTRWVRGVFFQGAPLPSDLASRQAGERLFPIFDIPAVGAGR